MKGGNKFLAYYGLALAFAGLGALLLAITALIGRMMGHEVPDWTLLGSTFLGVIWFPAGLYVAREAAERAELESNQ